jgi:monofunctional biosynthetic peptidoglycan transglycosylase
MEVYLNSIEMGNGVYGAQAAAEHWYRKEAGLLTKVSCGNAAILPNPRKYAATSSSSPSTGEKPKFASCNRRKIDYSK